MTRGKCRIARSPVDEAGVFYRTGDLHDILHRARFSTPAREKEKKNLVGLSEWRPHTQTPRACSASSKLRGSHMSECMCVAPAAAAKETNPTFCAHAHGAASRLFSGIPWLPRAISPCLHSPTRLLTTALRFASPSLLSNLSPPLRCFPSFSDSLVVVACVLIPGDASLPCIQALEVLARTVTWCCTVSSRAKRLGRLTPTSDCAPDTAALGTMLDVSPPHTLTLFRFPSCCFSAFNPRWDLAFVPRHPPTLPSFSFSVLAFILFPSFLLPAVLLLCSFPWTGNTPHQGDLHLTLCPRQRVSPHQHQQQLYAAPPSLYCYRKMMPNVSRRSHSSNLADFPIP